MKVAAQIQPDQKAAMPGSSLEVANAFLGLAHDQGRSLDQMQLQELVYIAHGWCLAMTGQSLTGDAPEAMVYGHEYRRLAHALAAYGASPVTELICETDAVLGEAARPRTNFSEMERNLIASIFSEYGRLSSVQMALLTREPGSPWEQVYAEASGMNRELPNNLMKAQFLGLTDAVTPSTHKSD